MDDVLLQPVGVVHSPFRERFGIPRQPGLIPEARGTIELLPPCNTAECVRALETFSHIWVLFHFHALKSEQWHATVRPPRLGGNRRVGVFAARSPFRPNPVGLSVLRLEDMHTDANGICLEVSGLDLLDGTPVLDIKPYVPYVDAIPEASPGFAKQIPEPALDVRWDNDAGQQLRQATSQNADDLAALVARVIALDPRPAYRREDTDPKRYRMRLADVDVEWQIQGDTAIISSVTPECPAP